jgi:hypothetical protein
MERLRCVLKWDGDAAMRPYHAIPTLERSAEHTTGFMTLQFPSVRDYAIFA